MDNLARWFGNEVTFWGRNATIAATPIEEMYAYDQPLDWNAILDTAYALDIGSSSAADACPAGTGARVVRIFGLDANFNPKYRDIALNGQTKIVDTVLFRRVFGAEVISCGSGGTNAGDIHIIKTGTGGTWSGGVPPTLTSALCKVLVGYGSSGNGMYTVPAGVPLKAKGLLLSCRAQACTFYLMTRDLDTKAGTFAITIAAPGVATMPLHGFVADTAVIPTTTGALPTGLTAGTMYFVRNPTADTFELAATPGGVSITTSGTQSGVHTATLAARPAVSRGTYEVNVSLPLKLDFENMGIRMWFPPKTDIMIRALAAGASGIASVAMALGPV